MIGSEGGCQKSIETVLLLLLFAVTVLLKLPGRASAQLVDRAQAASQTGVQAIREIDDQHSGTRWLLMRDPICQGGPGRLVAVAGMQQDVTVPLGSCGGTPLAQKVVLPSPTVIRAGDCLIVETSSEIVKARLEAVALGPASVGSIFAAKLKIGSKVVRVVAVGPGRAVLKPRIEVLQ
jgi:hypothetical protein